MDYRLLSIRPVRTLKRLAVACLIILTSMQLAVRNYYDDAEGFQLTIRIRLLLPGRSLFNKWNMRALSLLIYCICLLFLIQKPFLKKLLPKAQQNLEPCLNR